MGYQTTTFVFTNIGESVLNLNYAMVYGMRDEWVTIMPHDQPPVPDDNPGIGWFTEKNPSFSTGETCTVYITIDPEIVNKVPYASDGASLLFSINGSNLHINIHADGSLDSGVYGSTPDAVSWDANLGKTGGVSVISCRGK